MYESVIRITNQVLGDREKVTGENGCVFSSVLTQEDQIGVDNKKLAKSSS